VPSDRKPASRRVPSYRRHKPTGQAVVTLDGRDFYLGAYGSPKSRAEYDRLIGEWLQGGRALSRGDAAGDLTVNELLVRFLDHADRYYLGRDGQPGAEAKAFRWSIRPLRDLYGHTLAKDFGPRALKVIQQRMVDDGLCRAEVNKRAGKIKRIFKWAVSEELVPASVHQALTTVEGLRRGRTEAREPEPVKPVPEAFVDAIELYVSRQVWVMVQLQRLTGMRPGEVVTMRTIDVDTSGRVWTYRPPHHKTEHHGRGRVIYLGPRAQAVLGPWLRTELERPLFSPAEAEAERKAEKRANRKTPIQPSQRDRRKRKPTWRPRDAYDVASYRRAIRAGCGRAGVPSWHPHQLRHNAATAIRKEFGIEASRIILGHSSIDVTTLYAEPNEELAMKAMERLG